MQFIYHSPMRPLWLGFGSAIGQPYAGHDYVGKPNAFKVGQPLEAELVEKLELVALPPDGSPDDKWLAVDYERFVTQKGIRTQKEA